MCNGARPQRLSSLFSVFLVALCLEAALAIGSASAQESQQNASDGKEKSSESALPTSDSFAPPVSEPTSPTEAYESLLEEWELFTSEWDKFYPTLEALGIELGELPSYLESLENSLVLERAAHDAERSASDTISAGQAITIEDQKNKIASLKRSVSILSYVSGAMGLGVIGVLVWHLASAQPP